MQCPIGPERGGSSLGTNRSHWKFWVPGRFAFCFLSPSHDSSKLKLLWSGCSNFSMEGPQQHPSPWSPDPSTEELIPTMCSAFEHSIRSHTDPRAVVALALPVATRSLLPQRACPCASPWCAHAHASCLQKRSLAAAGLELFQAQRAEGNNPGRRRGMALDSRESRGGCAVLTEGMAKASSPCQRQGE